MSQKVSVIIPVYNAEPFVEQCLRSVLNQTYTDLEVIVVDDGSTDGSMHLAETIAKSDERIKVLAIAHAGQSAARNIGMQAATGEYICFVDADDWLDRDFIETHLLHAAGTDVVQSGYRRIRHDGKVVQTKHPHHFYQFTSPCMRLYRKDVLADIRFPEGIIYEDVIFSLRLWAKRPKHTLIPYIGYNYRLNDVSTTARINRPAQQTLYATIRTTRAPWWLKLYTLLRLKIHFLK